MPVNIQKLSQWKQQGRAIVVLTAWDYAIAQLLDEAGVDIILVGDSMAMANLGYKNTLSLTMPEMLDRAQSVVRGVKNALVACDLPFLSYQQSTAQAIESAGLLLKQAGVQGVKVEGGYPEMAETVRRLVQIGIPVMGHVGLTPQSVHQLGYRQQGKDEKDGDRILNEAVALEQAGAFAIVLEHIPSTLAAQITQKLSIPTIGIGAGSGCDGQVLVTADLLGLSEKQPPFAKSYANLRQIITQAVQDYSEEVRNRQFPGI
jgi:3-methyl-2-oxobutanoate hydroxymethyltransferase